MAGGIVIGVGVPLRERVEMTKVPGATRSGLNRPEGAFDAEADRAAAGEAATWSLESVMDSHGWLVCMSWSRSGIEHFQTWLVMLRSCSMAPDGDDVLGRGRRQIVSGMPPVPSSSPLPALPAEKTYRSGWEPGHSGQGVADGGIVAGGMEIVGLRSRGRRSSNCCWR